MIKPVSVYSLPKTGIFADKGGDFRRFPPLDRRIGSPETKPNARKAGIDGPISPFLGSRAEGRNAWLGRQVANLDMAISNSVDLACSRGAIEPHFVGVHKPLGTLEFGEPYQIRESIALERNGRFGEERADFADLVVRSSNQKSLLILG